MTIKEQMDSYFRNMKRYPNEDREIRLRFLYKIYQVLLDPYYNRSDRAAWLKRLIDTALEENDPAIAALDLCFAYKAENMEHFGIAVPVKRLDEPLHMAVFRDEKLPVDDPRVLQFHEAIRPDGELIDLFNVWINRDQFNRNPMRMLHMYDKI